VVPAECDDYMIHELPESANYCAAPGRTVRPGEEGSLMIRTLLVAVVVLLVATFPATWLLMLFLGNVGMSLGYWGTLPLGILVSALLSGSASRSYVVSTH
jgi:hypothetical protein